MTEFKKVINDNIWSVLTYVLIEFTIIFLPLIAVIYGRLHREVAKFMAGFNEKLMVLYGMYAKTQKAVVQGGKNRYDYSWIAIALTAEEAEKLKGEEHVFYVHEGMAYEDHGTTNCAQTCCCGVVEII
ncbi:hypothetical protein HDU79_006394 [Rhizoclosmatium sp. JEL0117]|nr:hypothetical protein HDU79_006394 [Rhizoclosmatium sp. JEL0117]